VSISTAYQPDMLFIPEWHNRNDKCEQLFTVTGRLIAYCSKKDIFGQYLAALPECWSPGTRESAYTYLNSIEACQTWCISYLKGCGYRIVKPKLIVMT